MKQINFYTVCAHVCVSGAYAASIHIGPAKGDNSLTFSDHFG